MILTIPTYLPSNNSTKETIRLVKNVSPEDYKTLCEDVNFINKNVSCGGFDGGCYQFNKQKTLFVGNDQRNESFSAVILIHELCHREQIKENRQPSEVECYKKGSDFLDKILVY